MSWIEALVLGILQGLTEFLPVSSSGHLELGKVLLNTNLEDNLTFTVLVHGATVLSTIVVFWKDIIKLLSALFSFKWNEETKYLSKIVVSFMPVAIIGLFFKDYIDALFNNNAMLMLVGIMLLITAVVLAFTFYAKEKNKDISYKDAFIIGVAQACAVMPGISRSGSTIATGLLLGNKRKEIARFSFLMVLIPILGENFLELLKGDFANSSLGVIPMIVGFVAAFISGLLACKWMISLVNKGKLIYFAIYCAIVGAIAIVTYLL